MAKERIIIVGAGILGCSLAYHLARRGHACRVVEREHDAARHASGKSAGMLRCLYLHPQLTEWALQSIQLLPAALREREIRRTGSVIVGRKAPEHHKGIFEEIRFADRLRDGAEDFAVYCSADGLINSESFTRSIAELGARAGVEFSFHCPVRELSAVKGIWRADCDGAVFESDTVVNAAGPWLDAIVLKGGVEPAPRSKTQAFTRHLFTIEAPDNIAGEQPSIALPGAGFPNSGYLWDERDEFYIRPLGGGRALFSICDESFAGIEAAPQDLSEEFRQKYELYQSKFGIRGRIPEILSRRACLRTYLPDRLPVVGEDAANRGYYWFGAFGGFGMSTGFGAADDLAKVIAGETGAAGSFGVKLFLPREIKEP